METTKRYDEKGNCSQTNKLLDDTIETYNKFGVEHNDEMIKELTIQKFEYGRMCLLDMFAIAHHEQAGQSMESYYKNIDAGLKEQIVSLGGKPKGMEFIELKF
jgi:hypothetical protein